MPTIEDKLDELERLRGGMRATVEDIRYPAAKAAIIEIWNAAEKVMKAFVELEYLPSTPSGWYCSYCCDGRVYPSGHHIPSTCHVAAAQAVLARMEGTDELQGL